LVWNNINIQLSDGQDNIFEIYKPPGVGTSGIGYARFPSPILYGPYVFSCDGSPPPHQAPDLRYAPHIDGLLNNSRFRADTSPDGKFYGLTYDTRWKSRIFMYETVVEHPWVWNEIWSDRTDTSLIYEFTYRTTVQYGTRLLPDIIPANNSRFISVNPNLNCHIITNHQNFTLDNSPVFVSIETNHTGAWVEIWNNTVLYGENFHISGTFNINSSLYNFSFNEPNVVYYWKVNSRKLTPGAEWTNKTFSFTLQPVIAGFTYTAVTESRIQFNSTSEGAIDFYIWDFGDGKTITGRYPQHINPVNFYNGYGEFTVTLSVENDETGFRDSQSQTLTAGPPPVIPKSMVIQFDFAIFIPIIAVLLVLAIIKLIIDQIKKMGDIEE